MEKVTILVDSFLKDIVDTIVIHSKPTSLNYQVEIELSNPDLCALKFQSVSLAEISSFGKALFYIIHSWNRRIDEKIKLITSETYPKDRDRHIPAKITVPTNYADNFPLHIKGINNTTGYDVVEVQLFDLGVNFDHLEFEVVNQYNNTHGTNFKVLDIWDDDGLDYASIQANQCTIIDVFCLGFMTAYDDITKMSKLKPS